MELVDKKEYSKPTFLSVFAFACYAILALCANEFGLGYNGVSPTNDYLYYGYGSVILSIILGISLIVIFTFICSQLHDPSNCDVIFNMITKESQITSA